MYLYPCRVVVGPASSTVLYKSNYYYYSAWVKIHGIDLPVVLYALYAVYTAVL